MLEANLAKTATELKTRGGTLLGARTDVSKRNDVELLARQALDAFGQVHLLFNNERKRPPKLCNEPVTTTPEMQAGEAAFKVAMEASMPPLQVADVVRRARKAGRPSVALLGFGSATGFRGWRGGFLQQLLNYLANVFIHVVVEERGVHSTILRAYHPGSVDKCHQRDQRPLPGRPLHVLQSA
jgi:NAD(P)-dependent dehydrogenase (short-subunit alcohol dehydrogenase family)